MGTSVQNTYVNVGDVHHCCIGVYDVPDLASIGQSRYMVYFRNAADIYAWLHIYPAYFVGNILAVWL